MIHKPTALILGAGASMPYGFPSGEQLRNSICRLSSPCNDFHQLLVTEMGCDSEELRDFARVFHGSNVASIDAFLARRPEYTEFGKLSIAVHLCQLEMPKRVNPGNPEEIPKDHWYYYLWNTLIQEASSIEDFLKNDVRFVTFNYDRSLEYFLHTSIRNTYGLNDEKALNILGNFPVLHVYGSLGTFHFLSDGKTHRQFSNGIDRNSLTVSKNEIRVIPEDRQENPFLLARRWCFDADRIGILGFGFDQLNVDRLGLKNVIRERLNASGRTPYIAVSTLHKTLREINHYKNILGGIQYLDHRDADCTMTLRESGLLFT